MGQEGYTEIVKRCMGLTWKLAEKIRKIEDLDIVVEPITNVLGIKSTLSIARIAGELRGRGWAISLFPQHIRIVLMPHLREEHLETFLLDLRAIMHRLRG
jgi:tyrosine decarboxylase/aspartate 1-decarboxylase